MKLTDLAWMAGVLDLKGRVLYKSNQHRRTRQLVLAVETKELGIIRQLCQLTGTKAEQQAAKSSKEWMRRSCTEHCPEAHVHVNDDKWQLPAIARWTITGAGMVVVYENLKEYLTIDRYAEAVAEADAFVALDSRGSAQVLGSLQRLRNMGWNLPSRYSQALDRRQQYLAEMATDEAA
jgi:hypothetical protein